MNHSIPSSSDATRITEASTSLNLLTSLSERSATQIRAELDATTLNADGLGQLSLDDTELAAGGVPISESFSVLRSEAIPLDNLLNFAARCKSSWALDAAVIRMTAGDFDWPSVRASAVRYMSVPRTFDPVLDRVTLDTLWQVSRSLHERNMDIEAESGLLSFIAHRLSDGKKLSGKNLLDFMEVLIASGQEIAPGICFPRLSGSSWRHHALSVELDHPRFGGDYEIMLTRLNQGLRKSGLEPVGLSAEGASPFEKLSSAPSSNVEGGPLVSVVLAADAPSTRLTSAIQSIINQTYTNWELVIVAAASDESSGPSLDEIAAMDPRIRILKQDVPLLPYEARNVGVMEANGEFITFQTVNEWSHPRRLELQVRELLAAPSVPANMVKAARLSDHLSLVGPRGARLRPSEQSLMVRRSILFDQVGFFDAVTYGGATELVGRIEAITGRNVGLPGPDAPLQFSLDDGDEENELNFGSGTWMSESWLAYRGSIRRFHKRITSGQTPGYVAHPQEEPALSAPPAIRSSEPGEHRLDVLVILDGHAVAKRKDYIGAVVDEILSATESGLSVGLLQSDAPDGVRNTGPLSEHLQMLIDNGTISQVLGTDSVVADCVVVRQAGAAQGHAPERRPISTNQVFVIEDPAAGDARGETFSRADVTSTVRGWFGQEPVWQMAPPSAPRARIVSVVVNDDLLWVYGQPSSDASWEIVEIRLGHANDGVSSAVAVDENGLTQATFVKNDLPDGNLSVFVVQEQDGTQVMQRCQVNADSVLCRRDTPLVVPDGTGALSVLKDPLLASVVESTLLTARVTTAKVYRGEIQLEIEPRKSALVDGVVAVREVEGRIRTRHFTRAEFETALVFTRAVEDLLDVRWRLYGQFQTTSGLVLMPIDFDDKTAVQDSTRYRIRRLTDDGVGVIHVVPQGTRRPDAKPPQLSIVMPVYNVAPFLDASIGSVLAQDFEDFELIIIDDASSDNGRKIIEMYAAIDPRIRTIYLDHNTLGGAGIPSNLGIQAARGKYLAFVDSDDWITKSALDKMVKTAEESDADLVIGDFRTFDENERSVSESYDSAAWRGIPLNELISGRTHPSLFRLSPVPWRKLYRRSFLEETASYYPEGDFFYEDNPLHWKVLSRAQRIVAVDDVVSYHRMEREGQTMAADAYKLGAIVSHVNTILNSLSELDQENRALLFEQFVDYASRQRWVVRKQTNPAIADMLKTRLARIYDRAANEEPGMLLPEETKLHFAKYRDAYPRLNLTVVIPVFNSADLLAETLDSVLAMKGIEYDILLIDDGSTDNSLRVMRKYESAHDNVHVFTQKNRGAGRARNAVIPLITGRYTYFLDADDVVDPNALARAVKLATKENSDLMFMKYKIDFVDERRIQGMFGSDREIWGELEKAASNQERQALVSALINYPWNRIVKTDLLHDANIFFGATVVNNDVLYHWHSILAAETIGFLNEAVCTHRKFKSRDQVTNIQDERRMVVLEALRSTHARITMLPSYSNVAPSWRFFAKELIEWAGPKVPNALRVEYEEKAGLFLGAMEEETRESRPCDDVPAE